MRRTERPQGGRIGTGTGLAERVTAISHAICQKPLENPLENHKQLVDCCQITSNLSEKHKRLVDCLR